ncbi:MAG: flagellar biosynthesis anti-sigma factor FlgM [Planctomycetaceae bacterium]
MEVRGLNSIGATTPLAPASPVEVQATPAAGPTMPRDEVEISALGRMLDDASRVPGVREERLAQIKSAIEAGTYETPEKLQIALERMLTQIGTDEGFAG